MCVCLPVCQLRACMFDDSSPVQDRSNKFGTKDAKHLKILGVLGVDLLDVQGQI